MDKSKKAPTDRALSTDELKAQVGIRKKSGVNIAPRNPIDNEDMTALMERGLRLRKANRLSRGTFIEQ